MNDLLFKEVKNNVSILEYIRDETGSKVFSAGSNLYRVNPCPLCDHNDCFTIYVDDSSFNCFSCQKAGDVINFEKFRKNLKNNIEAAKSIAEKKNISIDQFLDKTANTQSNPKKPIKKKSSKKLPKSKTQSKDKEDDKSAIDQGRAKVLRGIAADFYHDQLLNNRKALDYQTKKRGHSIETLKAFKVGYSGRKSIISHIKEIKEYSIDDLVNIGIVNKLKKGFVPTIPSGFYVYPHFINEKIVYFSIKDPTKKKKFQIKKKYAGDGWICFNQDGLTSKDLIIVEGEDDLLSIADKARQNNVIATLGEFNTPNILKYLKENSKDKTYYLCFDSDAAGQKYTKGYLKAILEGGGKVFVIEIPGDQKDIDDFLKASADPQDAFKKLVKDAKEVQKPEPSENGDAGGTVGDLYNFDDVMKVVGEDRAGNLYFWSVEKKKMYISSLKDFNIDRCVQIGGETVRRRVVSQNKTEKQILFRTLKKKLIVEAGRKQLDQPRWTGQGIHLLKNGRLLIVNGADVQIWDGKKFEVYESPLIEGRFIDLRSVRKWIDLDRVMERVLRMDKERIQDIQTRVLDLFAQWRFFGKMSLPLVTGFLFAQIVQQIWSWRPHLWVTSSQGTGKTILAEMFEAIGGNLSAKRDGSSLTEPGFRQDIGSDSCLCVVDEFEATNRGTREQIIQYLRSANRGGIAVKGGINQVPIYFDIKHMVMVASIEVGLARAAEKSRFIVIELEKDNTKNPKIPSFNKIDDLRVDVFSYAIYGAFRAKQLVEKIGNIPGYENRFVEGYAVPLSMFVLGENNPEEDLKNYVIDAIGEREKLMTGVILEDEEQILEDILSSTIRIPEEQEDPMMEGTKTFYTERMVSQLLHSWDLSQNNKKTLEAHGIHYSEGSLYIHAGTVNRKLLKDTAWKGLNISDFLNRLPGAKKGVPKWFGGKTQKTVYIPFELKKDEPDGEYGF